MKGFGIEIKNNLLDPKHVEKMNTSIWLYLLLIDKITSVNEDGIGLVLGGRPITYEEINEELGISRATYGRWIKILCAYPYIEIKRAPKGIIFRVFKAFKKFKNLTDSDVSKMTHHSQSDVSKSNSDVSQTVHPITYRQLTKTITKEYPLPEWLNYEVWKDWTSYRKEIKKTLTSASIKGQLKLLEENKKDHVEIIRNSIRNGWTGLFPLKNKDNGKDKKQEYELYTYRKGNDYVKREGGFKKIEKELN